MYFDSVRDIYEAVTIYSFLQLLLAYIGGESAAVVHFRSQAMIRWPCPCCCLAPHALDHHFLRLCKQWTIQFVFLKPIMALAVILLEGGDMYGNNDYSWGGGYLYVQLIYNVSYTLALYGLGMFYQSTSAVLEPYNPVKKFAMVKAVVFLTYWQGFGLSLVANVSDTIKSASNLQSVLICCEMFLAATLHCRAFPATEYHDIPDEFGDRSEEYGYDWTSSAMGGHRGTTSKMENLANVVSVSDVITDAYNNYSGKYTEYALQSDVAAAFEVFNDGDVSSPSSRENSAGETPESDGEERIPMDMPPGQIASMGIASLESNGPIAIKMNLMGKGTRSTPGSKGSAAAMPGSNGPKRARAKSIGGRSMHEPGATEAGAPQSLAKRSGSLGSKLSENGEVGGASRERKPPTGDEFGELSSPNVARPSVEQDAEGAEEPPHQVIMAAEDETGLSEQPFDSPPRLEAREETAADDSHTTKVDPSNIIDTSVVEEEAEQPSAQVASVEVSTSGVTDRDTVTAVVDP